MKQFTLTDLIDHENLLAWLTQDGNPPTVTVRTREPHPLRASLTQTVVKTVPVSAETVGEWWHTYRYGLQLDFIKSPHNRHKKQTDTQFLQECLTASGIRGGTVAARVQRAIAARPDLYRTPAQVKADAEAAKIAKADADRLAAAKATVRKTAAVSIDASQRQREAARKAWATRRARLSA